jgi:hypothetical protein
MPERSTARPEGESGGPSVNLRLSETLSGCQIPGGCRNWQS